MTDQEVKVRLLFVDDEESFLRSMSKRLELRGMEVHSFTNAADALKAMQDVAVDVALLDLKMPGMDGEELLLRIKELHPHVEVVILTGHGQVDNAVRTMQYGAFHYLQKPCEIMVVLDVIMKAYAKRVVARNASKSAQVEKLLSDVMVYSPLALIEELKKIDKETK